MENKTTHDETKEFAEAVKNLPKSVKAEIIKGMSMFEAGYNFGRFDREAAMAAM